MGMRISTRKPRPGADCTSSSAKPSKSSSKRRRSALSPTPPTFAAADGGHLQPAPSSRTVSARTSGLARRCDSIETVPPAICGAMPWTMLFSTSGCSVSGGIASPSVAGSMRQSTFRRSPRRSDSSAR